MSYSCTHLFMSLLLCWCAAALPVRGASDHPQTQAWDDPQVPLHQDRYGFYRWGSPRQTTKHAKKKTFDGCHSFHTLRFSTPGVSQCLIKKDDGTLRSMTSDKLVAFWLDEIRAWEVASQLRPSPWSRLVDKVMSCDTLCYHRDSCLIVCKQQHVIELLHTLPCCLFFSLSRLLQEISCQNKEHCWPFTPACLDGSERQTDIIRQRQRARPGGGLNDSCLGKQIG